MWAVFGALAAGTAAGLWNAGRVLHDNAEPPLHAAVIFSFASLAGAAVMVLPRRFAGLAALIGVVCVSTGLTTLRAALPPGASVARAMLAVEPGAEPPFVVAEGTVVRTRAARAVARDDPESHLFAAPNPSFTLSVRRWVTDPAAEAGRPDVETPTRVRVVGAGVPDDIAAGEMVRVRGMLAPVGAPRNPGERDRRLQAILDGEVGSIVVSPGGISGVDGGGGFWETRRAWFMQGRERSRAAARRVIAGPDSGEADTSDAGSLVLALTLGVRDAETDALRTRFREAGIAHLLAISGFHVAVLFALVVGLVRISGDRPRAEAVASALLAGAVLVLVPAEPPIVRALLMIAAAMLPGLVGRGYDRLAVLAWVACALLLWRPAQAFSLGFHLTVGITAFLLWLSATRHPWASIDPEKRWAEADRRPAATAVISWLGRVSLVYVMCWAVSAPLIAYHTGSVVLGSAPAALLATPFITVALGLGYAAIGLGLLGVPLAGLAGDASEVAAAGAIWVVSLAESVPGARLRVPPVSLVWTAIATGVVLAFIRSVNPRSVLGYAALFLICGWLAAESRIGSRLPGGISARVDMLAVDDGTCVLLRSGDEAVLWDCGSLRPGLGAFALPRAFHALGALRVRTAIVTHDNLDHYGALGSVAGDLGLERVFVSAPALRRMLAASKGTAPSQFLAAMERAGVEVLPISAGDRVSVGTATIDVIWPGTRLPRGVSTSNDASVVAAMRVPTAAGERRVLLCGDIQRSAMVHLLDGYADLLDSDVLELPHHGSYHAAAARFVEAVGPSIVLQSTGRYRLRERR
ncbi:MAG: ComEC/Rec2 family competence protein [Planctomycetota bacterium]